MKPSRRLLTLVMIALLGLMLLLYAGHGAHHGHHHHHQECAICRVMDGWFSLLKGANLSPAAASIRLAALLIALAMGASPSAPRQDITPVTLKVKMTS